MNDRRQPVRREHVLRSAGRALAYSGFFINLFNLIPLSPFDGGRITAVISPKLWLVGVPILVALFFYLQSPLLILMAILALPHVVAAARGDDQR